MPPTYWEGRLIAGNGRRERRVAKPEIIGSARSSHTRIVRMACMEKGIGYTLTEAELGSPEVFAIHPFGRMPVLRHGDFSLCESKAIITYLDRAFEGPELIPSDPKLGALAEQWVSLVNTTMDPLLVRC
jgi:glutathione S-transferase